MGIAPIPDMRALSAVKTPAADLQPPAVFDVEGAAKPGDESRQGSSRMPAGAEVDTEYMLEPEEEAEPEAEAAEEDAGKSVDYFA